MNPWNPVSDETDLTLERILHPTESPTDVYTPSTARRTDTAFMAAHLPKIPLKPGRFRLGKPISTSTTPNAANEYRPAAAAANSPESPPATTIETPRLPPDNDPDTTPLSNESLSCTPSNTLAIDALSLSLLQPPMTNEKLNVLLQRIPNDEHRPDSRFVRIPMAPASAYLGHHCRPISNRRERASCVA